MLPAGPQTGPRSSVGWRPQHCGNVGRQKQCTVPGIWLFGRFDPLDFTVKQLWEASTWLSHELLEALLWPFRSDPEGGARSRTWQQPLPPGTLQVQRPADPSPTAVARFPAPERWLLTRSLLPASTQGSLQQPWGGQRARAKGPPSRKVLPALITSEKVFQVCCWHNTAAPSQAQGLPHVTGTNILSNSMLETH